MRMKTAEERAEAARLFWDDDVPEWWVRSGKSYVVVKVQSVWGELKEYKVTVEDVEEYRRSARQSVEWLGGILGECRYVEWLAWKIQNWFEFAGG